MHQRPWDDELLGDRARPTDPHRGDSYLATLLTLLLHRLLHHPLGEAEEDSLMITLSTSLKFSYDYATP